MTGAAAARVASATLVLVSVAAVVVAGAGRVAAVTGAPRPYACSPGLRAPGAVGRPDAVSASIGDTRVTLAARSGGGLAHVLTDERVVVRTPFATLVRPLPRVVAYLLTMGSQVCLVAGPPAPSVIVLAYSGGAHCCFSALGFAATAAGLARPLARVDLADGAALGVANGRVVVRAAQGAFAYTFDDYAQSAEPIVLEAFDGRAFVEVTRDHPGLVRGDARTWDRLFARDPSDLSYLAAWVADESLLGRGALAWRRVDALEAAGRLRGTVGYPSGRGFARRLRLLLGALGYPSG